MNNKMARNTNLSIIESKKPTKQTRTETKSKFVWVQKWEVRNWRHQNTNSFEEFSLKDE